jgi:hypothetical protein
LASRRLDRRAGIYFHLKKARFEGISSSDQPVVEGSEQKNQGWGQGRSVSLFHHLRPKWIHRSRRWVTITKLKLLKLKYFIVAQYNIWLLCNLKKKICFTQNFCFCLTVTYPQLLTSLGRFREFYYWDTYWIVKALLHCDMSQVSIFLNFFKGKRILQDNNLTLNRKTGA